MQGGSALNLCHAGDIIPPSTPGWLTTEGGNVCEVVLNNHEKVRTLTDEYVAIVIVIHLIRHQICFLVGGLLRSLANKLNAG